MNNTMIRKLAPLIFAALLVMPAFSMAQDARDGINLRRTVVVGVVERIKEAVVNVSAQKIVTRRIAPFGGTDPFWSQFGQDVQMRANSLGSGFIIHSDGYVVTNNHVIDQARQITVELSDGRKLPATVISADPVADLAVLRVSDPKPLPVLELGDSDDLMIGEPAIAVGNPLGYSHSVSTGIVSALHRDLKGSDGSVTLANLIQTDAAINPGNSGGPLLNAYGQVIGINTAIRSDAQNIGFSIPVNKLRGLIPELMNPAQATKVEVPLHLSEKLSITPPAHLNCDVVTNDDPPRVVRTIDGKPIRNIVDAYAILLHAKAGDHLAITYAGGREAEVAATAIAPQPDAASKAPGRLGIGVEQVTPALAQRLQLNTDAGLLVRSVAPDSVAGRAGIEAGDVIVRLDRYLISTTNDLAALMPRLPQRGRVFIQVIRGDEQRGAYLVFDGNAS